MRFIEGMLASIILGAGFFSPIKAADQPGEWPMASRDYANTRFSPLDKISSGNAKDLRVAWTFSTGINKGQEAAPIVVGKTMFLITPYPNIVFALDLEGRNLEPLTFCIA